MVPLFIVSRVWLLWGIKINIFMKIYWYRHLATSNEVQKPYFHLGPFNFSTFKYHYLEYHMVIMFVSIIKYDL